MPFLLWNCLFDLREKLGLLSGCFEYLGVEFCFLLRSLNFALMHEQNKCVLILWI